MSAVTTNTQNILRRRLDDLTEAKALQVIEFIDSLEEHEPNEETIAAFKEAEDVDSLTTCTDLNDMLVKCGIKR